MSRRCAICRQRDGIVLVPVLRALGYERASFAHPPCVTKAWREGIRGPASRPREVVASGRAHK